MLLYFYSNNFKNLNTDLIFLIVMRYIFIIATLKFIEHKNLMIGFFNIYIFLVIILDISFSIYNYIINNIYNIYNINLKKVNANSDFHVQPDEIINSNFNIDDFKSELEKFNKKINQISKKKTIKIIKKENITESDINKFNENLLKKN